MAKTSASGPRITTLKRRADYQRVRKGARCPTPAFVLEAKVRANLDEGPMGEHPRFGFTVTRQVGKAVDRNRIRRRLKSAARAVAPEHAKRHFDYVLIARRAALTQEFATLVAELAKALQRVHRVPRTKA